MPAERLAGEGTKNIPIKSEKAGTNPAYQHKRTLRKDEPPGCPGMFVVAFINVE